MKKSNNSIGIMIMACVLGFAGMKAFDIEFNMHNLKMMLFCVAGSVVVLMLLFSLPGKSHENKYNYENYDREKNEIDDELAHQTPVTQLKEEQVYHQENANQEEEDNRYNQYQQPYQNPYQQTPEEDNRWS